MQPPSFMARYGPALAANGYPILPIMPGQKKPGRWRQGGWTDYPDWTRHGQRPTSEHELDIFCDPVQNHDFGTFPPNATVPSSIKSE